MLLRQYCVTVFSHLRLDAPNGHQTGVIYELRWKSANIDGSRVTSRSGGWRVVIMARKRISPFEPDGQKLPEYSGITERLPGSITAESLPNFANESTPPDLHGLECRHVPFSWRTD